MTFIPLHSGRSYSYSYTSGEQQSQMEQMTLQHTLVSGCQRACPLDTPPNISLSSLKVSDPLQVNPSNSLILPQDFFDVLHDLFIALGLYIHENLLTRIWKQEVRGRG